MMRATLEYDSQHHIRGNWCRPECELQSSPENQQTVDSSSHSQSFQYNAIDYTQCRSVGAKRTQITGLTSRYFQTQELVSEVTTEIWPILLQ